MSTNAKQVTPERWSEASSDFLTLAVPMADIYFCGGRLPAEGNLVLCAWTKVRLCFWR